MIKSSRDRDAEHVFYRRRVRGLGTDVQKAALRMLDAASVDDLRVPPGNRLERLRGDRAGQYSVRVNRRWRICFRWDAGDAQLRDRVALTLEYESLYGGENYRVEYNT